jgi:hypothetical protein
LLTFWKPRSKSLTDTLNHDRSFARFSKSKMNPDVRKNLLLVSRTSHLQTVKGVHILNFPMKL